MPFSDGLWVLAASGQDASMSFVNRLLLWFHVLFVIFTVGPVTLAVMSSPRAIRTRNVAVLRYLLWMTRIFGAATLGVFGFGMALGQSLNDLGQAWLTVSMTLYVVALVLLLLIMRDQRRAVGSLEEAGQSEALAAAAAAAAAADQPEADGEDAAEPGAAAPAPPPIPPAAKAVHVATVERGRIASMGGIVSVIWIVILVLMIWRS